MGARLNKKSTRWLSGGLVFLGIALVGYFMWSRVDDWRTLRTPQQIMETEQVVSPDPNLWKEEEIALYDGSMAAGAFDAYQAGDVRLLGEVSIPDARGMLLPILEGLTNWNAVSGAATMKPDQIMGLGNYTLGSHRLNNPYLLFSPLDAVSVGMDVWLNDSKSIYKYRVISNELLSPSQSDVLEDTYAAVMGVPIVTLVTCGDAYAATRRVVQAELVEVWDDGDNAPGYAKDAFRGNFSVLDNFGRWATWQQSSLG